jgi:protease-4
MKNKGLGCLVAFLLIALLVSLAVNFVSFAAALGMGVDTAALSYVEQPKKFHQTLVAGGTEGSKDKIVRIDIEGVISSGPAGDLFSDGGMNVEAIQRALQQAVDDPTVKAIVLRVNTPGGEVTASDNLYNAVRKAAAVKKVVVYMDSIAASGGYYLACGASKIVANETTLTASIGVIIQSVNYSQTFGKVGLETMTFASGKFKDTLSGSRPMREDEREYIQALVSGMYDKFVGIVASARKIDEATLRGGVADGRVVTGKQALEYKLVDQLGYLEDAYDLARELGGAPDAMVVKYSLNPSLAQILGFMGQAQAAKSGKIEIDVSDRLLPRLEPGKPYLLPAHMVR